MSGGALRSSYLPYAGTAKTCLRAHIRRVISVLGTWHIPLAARIFAVVDTWDALRSPRPYREAWPDERAREYIVRQSGKHFDPEVVKAFLKMLEQKGLPGP